jgi:acyl-CoA synthetase (NDP forming)
MGLKSLISPSSVAVVGASNREGSVGNAVMTNILSGGFIGKLFPVNPSRDTILGLKCYSSILDIEYQVDLAIIITPSKVVPHVMEECGKKGVKTAIIISAGFKETGEQGKVLEESIKRIAKNYDMRLVGPNCIGIINTDPKISLNASETTCRCFHYIRSWFSSKLKYPID